MSIDKSIPFTDEYNVYMITIALKWIIYVVYSVIAGVVDGKMEPHLIICVSDENTEWAPP